MATECTREAIQGFIAERGGRVKHADLIRHFRPAFPDDPPQRTAAREAFKAHVDSMAFVKLDNGVKFVCLKKQYRAPVRCDAFDDDPVSACPGGDDPPLTDDSARPPEETLRARHGAALPQPSSGELPRASSPGAAARGSGYGNDSQVNPPAVPLLAHLPSEETPEGGAPVLPCTPTDEEEEEVFSNGVIEMGNRWSSNRETTVSVEKCAPVSAAGEPKTAARGSSPRPAFSDDSVTPGREPGTTPPGTTPHQPAPHGRLVPTDATTKTRDGNRSVVARADDSPESRAHGGGTRRAGNAAASGSPHPHPRIQWDLRSPSPSDDDEGHEGGGDDSPATPRASRQAFIGLMIDSSPRVRRSMMLRNAARSDGDTASLASSSGADDDVPAVALDPLEHEWMLCASDGEWDSLRRLLNGEPSLLLKKDFVTGFTCLHWAAKQGKPELLALAAGFARRRGVPLDINSRSSAGGYTPLHLAAMHGHGEVVKLLVGACDADTEVRDYSGRKAAQYLSAGAARDLRDIMEAGGGGAVEGGFCDAADEPGAGRGWRFSKVLQPLRLLGPNEGGSSDQGSREKPLRRMSSLSRVKPRLQKLRDRTSQMVHSASFREIGELGVGGGHSRVRRKSGLTPADLVTLRGGDAD